MFLPVKARSEGVLGSSTYVTFSSFLLDPLLGFGGGGGLHQSKPGCYAHRVALRPRLPS